MNVAEFKTRFSENVPVHSMALLRICIGAMLMWQAYNKGEKLFAGNPNADIQFTYPFFEWVPAMPDYAHPLAIAWFLSGLLFAVGALFRVSAILALFLTAWGYLISADLYLNHEYMEMIFIALLAASPAHHVWSVDAWRLKLKPHAPRLMLDVLRFQLEIVLIYAGLVKINSDWLYLQPLSNWLSNKSDLVFFGAVWTQWWGVAIGGYGIILLHVLGAPLLYWRRTRIWIFLLYCGFHITNSMIFPIDIFPWMTIACTTLFFEPDWPLLLTKNILPQRFRAATAERPAATSAIGVPVLLVAAVFLLVQLVLPLRHFLYPGWVDWNDAGTRFAWRMMLAQRSCHQAEFVVYNPVSKRVIIPDLRAIFDVRGRPGYRSRFCIDGDILLQAAHMVRDSYGQAYGEGSPLQVHAFITKSLNYRAPAFLVDPKVDLAGEPRHRVWYYSWQTDSDALPELPPPFENASRQTPPVLLQDMVKMAVAVDVTHGHVCKHARTPGRTTQKDIVCEPN